MIPAKFHPEAHIEMLNAAEYYESQQFDGNFQDIHDKYTEALLANM